MTDLGILRNSLFDEIKRIKEGKADVKESMAISKIATNIISSYDLEVKALNSIVSAKEHGVEAREVLVFSDTERKKIGYEL